MRNLNRVILTREFCQVSNLLSEIRYNYKLFMITSGDLLYKLQDDSVIKRVYYVVASSSEEAISFIKEDANYADKLGFHIHKTTPRIDNVDILSEDLVVLNNEGVIGNGDLHMNEYGSYWTYELYSNDAVLNDLSKIGGMKPYHLEGCQAIHTIMVMNEMAHLIWKVCPADTERCIFMYHMAHYHDIGKAFTSIDHGDRWEYPDHAACGGFRGILSKYVDEDSEWFKPLQWGITNHIKPLFFQQSKDLQKDIEEIMSSAPNKDLCNISNLAMLAITDIQGSYNSKEVNDSQSDLIKFLKTLI